MCYSKTKSKRKKANVTEIVYYTKYTKFYLKNSTKMKDILEIFLFNKKIFLKHNSNNLSQHIYHKHPFHTYNIFLLLFFNKIVMLCFLFLDFYHLTFFFWYIGNLSFQMSCYTFFLTMILYIFSLILSFVSFFLQYILYTIIFLIQVRKFSCDIDFLEISLWIWNVFIIIIVNIFLNNEIVNQLFLNSFLDDLHNLLKISSEYFVYMIVLFLFELNKYYNHFQRNNLFYLLSDHWEIINWCWIINIIFNNHHLIL